jgi:hypothetical protein
MKVVFAGCAQQYSNPDMHFDQKEVSVNDKLPHIFSGLIDTKGNRGNDVYNKFGGVEDECLPVSVSVRKRDSFDELKTNFKHEAHCKNCYEKS